MKKYWRDDAGGIKDCIEINRVVGGGWHVTFRTEFSGSSQGQIVMLEPPQAALLLEMLREAMNDKTNLVKPEAVLPLLGEAGTIRCGCDTPDLHDAVPEQCPNKMKLMWVKL
jgi:hypothetical protein